ncbi:UPF0496 protein At1g20180 isoform X1 [Juglans microcarpa x Juglans regia]|uniref:UPF0496 protein At1g20180 isoform X1 n=2 Tax=Juglans microcarpa x Juglans regia TaxID=2249226 RepID=UPI001B7E265C|nr:UPF0496 protein At1g20180 isoform X1 [Juglans microcarpa x Juglans regia]
MTQMRKIGWPKLKFPFGRAARSRKERANSLSSKLSVNEEYMEAFRTKSYIEIWSKVQGQLGGTNNISNSSKLSSSPSLPLYLHLSEYLLEPSQETLVEMIQGMNLHYLLMNYFEASFEACKVCELLLQSIHQTRANYRKIKLGRSGHDHADHYADKQYCQALLCELAAFAVSKNPLSNISTMQFRDIHDGHMALFHRLTSKYRKIKRGASFHRIWKRACGISLCISHTALLILLLILALHSMVGIVAAPTLLAFSLDSSTKKMKGGCGGFKTRSLLDRLGEQLDVAAKGVYILINDFDTISRMVKRLNDEVEHRKAVADMCVRNGKCEILKEVVREFHIHESSFLDQLEELEEHIYLCFLTINTSRRLVIQEIMEAHH